MAKSFYGKMTPGQMQGIVTRPSVGLNAYSPPTSLNDNYLTDMIDISPFRNEGLEFYSNPAIVKLLATQGVDQGSIRSILSSEDTTNTEFTFYALSYLAAGSKIHKLYYGGVPTITSYAITVRTAGSAITTYHYANATFKTLAETYQCFTASHDNRLHFIKKTGSTESYGYVDLPFFPKKMVAHASRLFIIDTGNTLWWCRGGDLYSWYSEEYDDDAIFTSTNMKATAYTLTNQPNRSRVMTFTHVITDTADTTGSIAVVGTNDVDGVQSETVVIPAGAGRVQTVKMYKTVTSATPSGWVQGGATPDTITMGWGPVGGYVQEDAGMWPIEQESELLDMCVLNNALYIFTSHNIYVFQGFDYGTFNLQPLAVDLGIEKLAVPDGYSCLSTVRNNSYFLYKNEVYEFDGNHNPTIISRPVLVNNAMTNGIMGGIVLTGSDWVLDSSAYGLYVYSKSTTPILFYYFDFETRTWWKKNGLTAADVSAAGTINIRLFPSYNKQLMFMCVTDNAATPDFYLSQTLGKIQLVQPFIVTKAFNTNPSETGTLTEVLLMLAGTSGQSCDIEVFSSLTEDADDFVSIKKFENTFMTGDVQVFSIPLPVSFVTNAHHYRLKVSIGDTTTYPVYLYNIERRFRVKGRAR